MEITKYSKTLTIKAERIKAGFTIKTMSDALSIPYKTIQHWEDGTRSPAHWAERLIIAELHRVSPNGDRNS